MSSPHNNCGSMRSLALFRPTFQRLQTTIQHGQMLKEKVLPTACNRVSLEKFERTMFILNCLDHAAMDLQSDQVDLQLHKFQLMLSSMKMNVSYDYQRKGFRMVREGPFNEKIHSLEVHLRSLSVQKFDHPVLRESLYFHELKHIDQLMKINYPKNAPKFIRDIFRRNVENDILDKENPLGLPVNAPSLQLLLHLNRLFTAELYCSFGNINIRSIRMLREQVDRQGQTHLRCCHLIDGMNIPRPVQRAFFDLCQNTIGLREPEFYLMHKMGYVGGRVEEIELLLNLYESYTDSISIE